MWCIENTLNVPLGDVPNESPCLHWSNCICLTKTAGPIILRNILETPKVIERSRLSPAIRLCHCLWSHRSWEHGSADWEDAVSHALVRISWQSTQVFHPSKVGGLEQTCLESVKHRLLHRLAAASHCRGQMRDQMPTQHPVECVAVKRHWRPPSFILHLSAPAA